MSELILFLDKFKASDAVQLILLVLYLGMSLVLFFVMGHDKALSKTHKRRVPEATLFLLALLGGGLGGVLGMQIFRHKTQHPKFYLGFPLIALVQWGLVIWAMLPSDSISAL